MTKPAPWTGARRNQAYRDAAKKYRLAQLAWEDFLRDDAYRTAGELVKTMYPDRPELKDLLEEIANQLSGEET